MPKFKALRSGALLAVVGVLSVTGSQALAGKTGTTVVTPTATTVLDPFTLTTLTVPAATTAVLSPAVQVSPLATPASGYGPSPTKGGGTVTTPSPTIPPSGSTGGAPPPPPAPVY